MLIVGLGNPGKEYEHTRHNLGFYFIDKIKEVLGFPNFELDKRCNALISKKEDIILMKPQTFMNKSGESVRKMFKHDLIVIHDEVEINLGEIKISKGITSHGHNGVESIINNIKTKDFIRIRIGINSEYLKEDLEKEVLKKFNKYEKELLKEKEEEILKKIIEVIENEKNK
ncbi:MAG: hypothetical protein MCSN_2190 [Candidatus Microsyncoccus archaeolyticus]|nr:MAG: hypothetical protein MCSN_2190 [Candidatus Parcubacteria bacterium]